MKKIISIAFLLTLLATTASPALAVPVGNNVEYIPAPRSLGVGVSDPEAKLEVNGQVMITGGSPQNGSVLTTDANGLATWEAINSSTNTAAGPTTAVQFNDAGLTSGSPDFVFNDSINQLTVLGVIEADSFSGDVSGLSGLGSVACTSKNVGLIRYDTSTSQRIYCDGSTWTVIVKPGVLANSGEWTGRCTTILPPYGSLVETYNIYYYWGHRGQNAVDEEKSHTLRGAGKMTSNSGIQACGSAHSPIMGTYMVIATPK